MIELQFQLTIKTHGPLVKPADDSFVGVGIKCYRERGLLFMLMNDIRSHAVTFVCS